MFSLVTFGQCLAALGCALLCWGTWGNLMKSTGLEYTISMVYNLIGQLILSTLWCFTLGQVSTDESPKVFTEELTDGVDFAGAVAAIIAGFILAAANALLSRAANMDGVSIAFPAIMGLGLVGGSAMNYAIEAKGKAGLLFLGIAMAVVALGFNARLFSLKKQAERKLEEANAKVEGEQGESQAEAAKEATQEAGDNQAEATKESGEVSAEADQRAAQKSTFKLFVIICLVAGVLSVVWSPIAVLASTKRHLHIYEVIFFFHFGMILPLPYFLWQERGLKSDRGSPGKIATCVAAGMMDCLGRILMFVSGDAVSFAMAFGIVMCSPMVAALEGVALGEMKWADTVAKLNFSFVLLFYGAAVSLLAISQL